MIACLVAYSLNKQSLPAFFRIFKYLLAVALVFEISKKVSESLQYQSLLY